MTFTDPDIESEISDLIRELFAPHQREITILQARIAERVRDHKSVDALQRRLVLAKAKQLGLEVVA